MKKTILFFLIILLIIVSCALIATAMIRKNKLPHKEDIRQPISPIVQVKAGEIETYTLHGYVQAYGKVISAPATATNMSARVQVTANASGVIKSLYCFEGQKVNAGDILFKMDSSLVDTAVKDAQATLQYSIEKLSRQEKLYEIKAVSEKSVQEKRRQLVSAKSALSKAKYQQSLATIRSSQAGTVIRVNTTQGASVKTSDVLAEICDLKRVVVVAQVPSQEITLLKKGQKVIIRTDCNHSEIGEVIFIDNRVNSSNGTVNIRISAAPNSGLLCGQFVSARIIYTEHTDCLTVPEESVVTSPAGVSSVALVTGDIASLVPVKTGLKESGRVEVSGKGIQSGRQVVTIGAYGLPDKTHIHILTR